MGKTSSAVKSRWNAKAYDQTLIRLPKGKKKLVDDYAAAKGCTFNGLVNDLLREAIGLSVEDWSRRDEEIEKDRHECPVFRF